MKSDEITISYYENEVPQFIEAEMDLLYGNIFSSPTNFRICDGDLKNVNTYVVRRDQKIITVFLFRHEDGKIQVMNEVITISSEEMDRFADYVFNRFGSVNLISFKAIQTDIKRFSYPYQRFNYSEDIAMALPATPDEYLASLGKNTRRNIKRYVEKITRGLPSYSFNVYAEDAVDERYIREIVQFNQARMASKNKISSLDENETQRITKLAKACGLVGVITINGRICAGAVSYRTGDNYFLDVLAHDPQYDNYWIGILCCYWTICECISRGGKEFHFLWGRYDYKFILGAVRRDLDYVAVYRSHLQFLRHADIALGIAYRGYLRQAKLWLNYRDSFISGFTLRLLNHLRNIKRLPAESLPELKRDVSKT
jgi:hypothetical protein